MAIVAVSVAVCAAMFAVMFARSKLRAARGASDLEWLIVLACDGNRDRVLALDLATGAIRWSVRV